MICSVIVFYVHVFVCLNSVGPIIIYSKATLILFIKSYLSFFGLLFIGLLNVMPNSRWRTRLNEVCNDTSYEIWMPKYVVSLSTVMQTLRVFAIIGKHTE